MRGFVFSAGLFLIVLIYFLKDTEGQRAKGVCQTRNETLAREVGRVRCRKPCIDEDDKLERCRNGRLCRCAVECGFTCINLANRCPPLGLIPNSVGIEYTRVSEITQNEITIDVIDSFIFNDTAQYQCSPGYSNEGEYTTHFCHGRRGWTGKSLCALICFEPNNEKIEEFQQICGSKCVTSDDCSGNLTCACDGFCGRTCIDINRQCPDAPEAENARLFYTGEGVQRVARYICNENYYLSEGTVARRCTGGGTWEGFLPVCERVTCGDPLPAIRQMRGEILNWVPGPYYPDHNFTFACNGGQRLFGNPIRICLSNGRWSGPEIVCDSNDNARRCRNPGVPINGRVILRSGRFANRFNVESVVEFRCNRGYALIGEQVQECLPFLQWTGNGAPICKNPAYGDSPAEARSKIQATTTNTLGVSNLQEEIDNSAGRSVAAAAEGGNEVYFIVDRSRSVTEGGTVKLEDTIKFLVGLVERLQEDALVPVVYSIVVFASDTLVLLDSAEQLVGDVATPERVIEILESINKLTPEQEAFIRKGTNTNKALTTVRDQIALTFIEKPDRERHIFLITDGQHNEGPNPVDEVDAMLIEFQGKIEFYSITTCAECTRTGRNGEAYTELLGLAMNKEENFIFIADFFEIQGALDLVTDARIDYSDCGVAGDVGDVKESARVSAGRSTNTVSAKNDRSWPWQAVISIKRANIYMTFKTILGGGSLLNNQWVLTAAHIFNRVSDLDDPQTAMTILITFGMYERPHKREHRVSGVVQMFTASEIILHKDYDRKTYDNDIALVRIGQEFTAGNSGGFVLGPNLGFVNYTEYIRTVCLPCESECTKEVLRKADLITDQTPSEMECPIEKTWLLEDNRRPNEKSKILAVITGFGHIDEEQSNIFQIKLSTTLRQGLINLEGDNICRERDPPGDETYNSQTMLCATSGSTDKNVDACKGDSGGPVVREVFNEDTKRSCWVQVGIVSWGSGCGRNGTVNGVENVAIPGYYTNVLKYTEWIQKRITGEDEDP